MKKLGLLFRETSQELIKNNLRDSHSIIVINYSKLSSCDLTNLRQSLRNTNALLFVVKNSVIRHALTGSKWADLVKSIQGPCGLVFIKKEESAVSHVLCSFSREHASLKIQSGFLKDKILNEKDIDRLASLPSKDILRAKVVMALNSPILGLVIVLNQTLRKFVYCLEQIKKKKE